MEKSADGDETGHTRAAKRKAQDPALASEPVDAKRRRLAEDGVGTRPVRDLVLPDGFWHRTFTLLPPKTLGCLLAVNRQFRRYLDPSPRAGDDGARPCLGPPSVLPSLKPDAIWKASRRLFWPHVPEPLQGRSEMEMWRLCCAGACQFCGCRERPESGRTQGQWHRGPGAKGVRPVFPFFLVTCGQCLSENTTEEVHIFLSPSIPSFLLAGLPMAFVTPELHVVPPQLLTLHTDTARSQVVKVFSSDHVKAIQAEFESVKKLGHAAAEEWARGLEARGKRSLADASRWESWYVAGGVRDMRTSLQGLPSSTLETEVASCARVLDSQASVHESQKSGEDTTQPSSSVRDLTRDQSEAVATELGPRPVGQALPAEEEAAKLRALRKAQIEERAAYLDPPFTSGELSCVPAFLAMIRIPAPLGKKAWERLKQRLLDHRAERRERECPPPLFSYQDVIDEVETGAPALPPPRKVANERIEILGPPFDMISELADDFIRRIWKDGANLSKKEASQFAVEVLLYVRKKFYAEVAQSTAATQGSACEAVSDLSSDAWARKLMLGHMKWIFETKIKKHTYPLGKNLFFCTGCPANRKPFGLQAVVQHYAAKHTTTLSLGDRVVCWQTEWPETPLFESDPNRRSAKEPGKNSKIAAPPHHHKDLPLPSNAPNQAFGHRVQASDASQAAPVSAPTKPQTLSANPSCSSQPYPSRPQLAQVADPRLPEQGAGISATRKDDASRKNKSAATADSVQKGQYVARLNFVARICKETWRGIANLQWLPDATKAHVLLHHIVARFEDKFSERASLSTFIDGLSNHRDMRPARGIKNLHCKACASSRGAEADRTPMTLPQLLMHFKSKHVKDTGDQPRNGSVDWRVDMIRSPDRLTMPELQKGFGKHEASLQLIIDALPWAGQTKILMDRRQDPITGNTQQMRLARNAGKAAHDVSRATGFQYQLDRTIASTNAKLPGGEGAAAANRTASLSHDIANYNYGDRPNLRPARAVYGAAESPPRYLPERIVTQGGKTCQAIPSAPQFRCADRQQYASAASAPHARVHENGFEILGTLESYLESQRGVVAAGDNLRRDARHGAQPRTGLDRVDHVDTRDYMDGRYGEPYPYSLPRYDGGMQSYRHEPGSWGSQMPSTIRQGTGYRPYGAYPQGFPVQSVQPADAYDVAVRDRPGDDPINRLVLREEGGCYPREPRAPDLYPRRAPVAYSEPGPPAAYAPKPLSRMDYEEYDPRYPETGCVGAAAASREARR